MADIEIDAIIKEGEKHYEKKEVNVNALIAEQEAIIASLQSQIDRANATIAELQGKK